MTPKTIEPQEVKIKLGQYALAAILSNQRQPELPNEAEVRKGWYLVAQHLQARGISDFSFITIGYDGMRNDILFDLSLRYSKRNVLHTRIVHVPTKPADLELMLEPPITASGQTDVMEIVPVQIVKIAPLELTVRVYSPYR